MSKLYRRVPVLCLVFCVAWCVPVQGQPGDKQKEVRSDTEGLFLDGHFQGNVLAIGDDGLHSGVGFGGKVGYGITPPFTLYLGVAGNTMNDSGTRPPGFVGTRTVARAISDDYTLVYGGLGARVNIRSGPNALVPYVDGSIAGVVSTYDTVTGDEIVFSGAVYAVGGGIQYFFSPQLAVNTGIDLAYGGYDEVEIGGESKNRSFGILGPQIDIGLSAYLP